MTDKKIIEIELSERDENCLIKLIKKFIRRLTRKEPERVREVTIKKTPLGKWKEITEIIDIILTGPLQKILEQKGIEDVDGYIADMQASDLLGLVPDLMSFAIDEVINLIEAGSGLDRKFIEEHVGPEDALNIIMAIIEVNKIKLVAEKGKNLMGLLGIGPAMMQGMDMGMVRKQASKKSSGKSSK